MSRKQLSMRKIGEVARLKASGLSVRQIARSCNVARSTVAEYLERLEGSGLSWPLPPELTEEQLEVRLFRQAQTRGRDLDRPLPEWALIHKELRRRAVTLKLLWDEYREVHPEGYGYSQYCELYRRWAKTIDVCLRQTYPAGERLFVDYAGMTMPVSDPAGGEAVRRPDLRGGARGESLPVRRSHAHPAAPRLDRLAHPHLRAPGRGDRDPLSRQPEERRDAGVPVRAGREPDLSGHGPVLRGGRDPAPAAQAARRRQGGKRGADRRARSAGPAAGPDVLLAGRVEPGDVGAVGEGQPPALPEAGLLPAGPVHRTGQAGLEAAAGGALRAAPTSSTRPSTSTTTSRSSGTTTACPSS